MYDICKHWKLTALLGLLLNTIMLIVSSRTVSINIHKWASVCTKVIRISLFNVTVFWKNILRFKVSVFSRALLRFLVFWLPWHASTATQLNKDCKSVVILFGHRYYKKSIHIRHQAEQKVWSSTTDPNASDLKFIGLTNPEPSAVAMESTAWQLAKPIDDISDITWEWLCWLMWQNGSSTSITRISLMTWKGCHEEK